MRAGGTMVALLALTLGLGGCATWRGARLYQSASAALERGETERAIQDLERASELVPHASVVQNQLGLAYAAEGREAEAREAFRRAVDLDCDNGAARYNLSLADERAAQAVAP